MIFGQRMREILGLYLAGFISGMALILYPAGGSLYQDPNFHGLSSSQFGSIFINQTMVAMVASLLSANIAQRIGAKWTYLLGQILICIAMSLLTITHFLLETSWIYPLMLLSTATMGAGFGIVLSLSNVYAYDLFKGREDAAVTAVQIIMGLGLVVGAPMLGVFIELEMWWGAPIFILLSLGGMMLWLFFLPLKLSIELDDASEAQKGHLNMRLVLYALLVFLYGASEATFSTWSTTFLELEQGYSTSQAAFGLSIFWLTIAIGRVLFAFSVHRINAGLFYLISPITIAVSFLFLPFTKTLFLSYAALILAGLGCSFFFPYSISRASAENLHQTTFASGILVASLQFGIGVSALVVGTLNDLDVISLPDLLSFSSVYAIGMTIIVVYLIRHRDDGVLPERR